MMTIRILTQEIDALLAVLPKPATTIFARAANAGFRAVIYADYLGKLGKATEICVEPGVWESVIGKTRMRNHGVVPVITIC